MWKLTPRQFSAQLDVHDDINRKLNGAKGIASGTKSTDVGYIDQIPGW